MKFTILILLTVLVAACGKNNESGKPSNKTKTQETYTLEQEDLIRKDFIREGQDVLRRYESVLKEMFGLRTVGLIRNRLKYGNVQVSERLLMNDRNEYTRSIHRNNIITLYIGRDERSLNWGEYHKRRNMAYTRLVMHELLLLGEIDDRNFRYTDKILIPARPR
jgi:hypothetical protein